MHLTGMICLWAENLTTNCGKMSHPHTMPFLPAPPRPQNTPFTLIGNVVPFQLTGTWGRDIWTQLVHFCLGLTVIRILINFDLHIIRK